VLSVLRSLGMVLRHTFRRRETRRYPEERPVLPARWRGRIVLTRDPDGAERCVACSLCAVVCPVACISLQADRDADGRRFARFFRVNFSRCIFCGLCEEACPTCAIQLTPDFEMAESRRQDLVVEKEDLLISGPGKVPGYNYYHEAGVAVAGRERGGGEHEEPPVDLKSLLP